MCGWLVTKINTEVNTMEETRELVLGVEELEERIAPSNANFPPG
jgi:hypothetical protein